MNQQDILDDLLKLLADSGVIVRRDAMGGGGGGICDIKGKKVFFCDTDGSSFDTAVSCAIALKCTIKDLEAIYIKPAVRDFIDKYTPAR